MKPSWMGTILEADASMKYKAFGDRGRPRLTSTVTIQIDRGDPKPYVEDIVELDRDENNIYQMEAPYKIGDTVVYFRGMKRFARLSIQGTEELFDPKFVCAFCGHINEERERCFRCGKILLK